MFVPADSIIVLGIDFPGEQKPIYKLETFWYVMYSLDHVL